MSRYIDADALTEKLNKKAQTDLEMGLYNHGTLTQSFIRFVERQPTASVAPRTEVAREFFEEIEKIRAKEINKCETLRAKEDDASERKYWEGGEHSLRQLSYWIAELKKKYTEEVK